MLSDGAVSDTLSYWTEAVPCEVRRCVFSSFTLPTVVLLTAWIPGPTHAGSTAGRLEQKSCWCVSCRRLLYARDACLSLKDQAHGLSVVSESQASVAMEGRCERFSPRQAEPKLPHPSHPHSGPGSTFFCILLQLFSGIFSFELTCSQSC